MTQPTNHSDPLDARLDAMLNDMDGAEIPPVATETRAAILNQMRAVYANTLQQAAMEMRIASKLGDEEMKKQVRANARRCVIALDEIDAMLNEIEHGDEPNGKIVDVLAEMQK